ncbi:MAG: hypothetical protein EB023_12655 [Flavobacteriia bacterium]|nr:hypothetical protein [Flavobacteriia bacterium]
MREAADLLAHLGRVGVGRRVGLAKQDVEDALGVGLHVAGEAAEELADRGAGLALGVLEEDGVSVGDLHEVVPSLARPSRLRGRVSASLHEDAGRVGGQAQRGREGLGAHRREDGGAERRAEVLEPSGHQAAVDGHAEVVELLFLPVERQPAVELVDGDVREERGRADGAVEDRGRHLRGDERGVVARLLHAVGGALDDEADHARAPVLEAGGGVLADDLGLTARDEGLHHGDAGTGRRRACGVRRACAACARAASRAA